MLGEAFEPTSSACIYNEDKSGCYASKNILLFTPIKNVVLILEIYFTRSSPEGHLLIACRPGTIDTSTHTPTRDYISKQKCFAARPS